MFSCIFLLRDLFARLRCQYLTDVVVNFLLMKMSWKFRLTAMSMMRRLVGVVALFILFSSHTCLLYIFLLIVLPSGFLLFGAHVWADAMFVTVNCCIQPTYIHTCTSMAYVRIHLTRLSVIHSFIH